MRNSFENEPFQCRSTVRWSAMKLATVCNDVRMACSKREERWRECEREEGMWVRVNGWRIDTNLRLARVWKSKTLVKINMCTWAVYRFRSVWFLFRSDWVHLISSLIPVVTNLMTDSARFVRSNTDTIDGSNNERFFPITLSFPFFFSYKYQTKYKILKLIVYPHCFFVVVFLSLKEETEVLKKKSEQPATVNK